MIHPGASRDVGTPLNTLPSWNHPSPSPLMPSIRIPPILTFHPPSLPPRHRRTPPRHPPGPLWSVIRTSNPRFSITYFKYAYQILTKFTVSSQPLHIRTYIYNICMRWIRSPFYNVPKSTKLLGIFLCICITQTIRILIQFSIFCPTVCTNPTKQWFERFDETDFEILRNWMSNESSVPNRFDYAQVLSFE